MLDMKSNHNDELAHPPLPTKPRLSMKYLHILIQDLQDQDQLLSQQIDRMEQQLIEYNYSRAEIAAADEQLRNEEESMTQSIESQSIQRLDNPTQANHSQEIRISRAERHAPLKRKSFRFWR